MNVEMNNDYYFITIYDTPLCHHYRDGQAAATRVRQAGLATLFQAVCCFRDK